MSNTSSSLTDATQEFSWMLSKFVKQTPHVQGAVAVSSDGLLMAKSPSLDRASAEPVAAIISGMTSLGQGAAAILEHDDLERIIVGMSLGVLVIAKVSDGSSIGVVARVGADIGAIGYQMTVLVERAGTMLTPALVAELQQQMLATA
jgi:predicted regulator of Ras-like GTPase activity (Roadblock/LC7/MglB family)